MAIKRKSTSNFSLCILHNDNPIVTRHFSTEGFNVDVKRSVDLNDIMGELVHFIIEEFKRHDMDYMYDKYQLKDDDFQKKWKSEIKSAKDYKHNKVQK